MHMNGYNVLNKDCRVVSLIKLLRCLSLLGKPKLLDYTHPAIREIIPCIKQGDKFTDLRTNKSVKVTGDILVWPVSVGTVFNYPDGESFLLSRRFADGKLLVLNKNNFTFNQLSMVSYTVK